MSDPLAFVGRELAAIDARDERRRVRSLDGPPGPRVTVDGRTLLSFASNGYLGLATHPEVVAAAQEAAARWGVGTGSARLITGSTTLHDELEAALAAFKGTEDAVLFGSGYLANLGAIATLAGPDDVILADALNHASLIDAVRASKAHRHVYAHADVEAVRALLFAHRTARRVIVVTDGVFSMDGDVAPLADLAKLCAEAGAILYVDDAHGTGVTGPGGRGSLAEAGVADAVVMGTLSKALGSIGGFVAGPSGFCDLLRNRARTFVFDTALPAPVVAAARQALRVLEREPELPQRVRRLAARFAAGVRAHGVEAPEPAAAIVPVIVGASADALMCARTLEDAGILIPAIRPPSVPEGTARLRVAVMAGHTEADVDTATQAMAKAVRR